MAPSEFTPNQFLGRSGSSVSPAWPAEPVAMARASPRAKTLVADYQCHPPAEVRIPSKPPDLLSGDTTSAPRLRRYAYPVSRQIYCRVTLPVPPTRGITCHRGPIRLVVGEWKYRVMELVIF